MHLVIGFGQSLGLALWPRAKPIDMSSTFYIKIDLKLFFKSSNCFPGFDKEIWHLLDGVIYDCMTTPYYM